MKRRDLLIEAILLLGALAFILPVVLIFVTSFKTEREVLNFTSLLPEEWTLANYRKLMGSAAEAPIARWLFNSLMVSSCVTVLVLAVDSLAAYALARLDLPGKRIVFALIVATLMVPGQVLLVPMYLILNRLGWLDTIWALVIPPAANAFGVFLLHQFFKAIPRELEEAAALDGCSRLGIYWRVVMPLSWPALATLAILTFIGSWNDFVGPLVYMDSSRKLTLPVGIALFQASYYDEYSLTLAASTIATVPVLILFLIFQKQIVRGMMLSGLKE